MWILNLVKLPNRGRPTEPSDFRCQTDKKSYTSFLGSHKPWAASMRYSSCLSFFCARSGVGNLRPAGHLWPAKPFNQALEASRYLLQERKKLTQTKKSSKQFLICNNNIMVNIYMLCYTVYTNLIFYYLAIEFQCQEENYKLINFNGPRMLSWVSEWPLIGKRLPTPALDCCFYFHIIMVGWQSATLHPR